MEIEKNVIEDLIKSRPRDSAALAQEKRRLSKKHKAPLFSNISLLKRYHELVKNKEIEKNLSLELLLKTRPIRSLSGIVNISVLTKPYACPGRCLYCPTESGIPKSYVSGEPAVERAKALKYDPYLQVKRRIEMLKAEGHPTDKIELRIVGGTWSYYPKSYQENFVKRCFQACNDSENLNSKFKNQNEKLQSKIKNLQIEQRKNERARHRIVGLSIETRPDFVNKNEIKHLRELGATMIELGVQSIYDDVLKLNLRGHGRKEIIFATKLLKDAGFKILYQMMPNLPGSDLKRDEKMFQELFENQDFQPDMLKIYPCTLLKEAPLYKIYKAGKYRPYSGSELTNLIKNIKKKIPCYVRIQRITRDIPTKSIAAGAKIPNLRQLISEDMAENNWKCNCIRCREVKSGYDSKEKIKLFRQNYPASDGKEIFLSFESAERKLYALLRLRIASGGEAIIRELHTYGQQLEIGRGRGETSTSSPQHRGLGRKLVREAEGIAKKETKAKNISVISGVGVREYFRKIGYRLDNTYMVKKI